MSQSNYFQINRKLLTHPLWIAEAFTKGQAWVDLIGTANHSPGYFFKRGVKIDIERGQTGFSIETWMKRWKWSKGKVSRFLNFLEKESMIEQKRGNQTTVITICNYNTYQSGNVNDGKPNSKADSKPSSKQTIKIKNEEEEIKRKKKKIYVEDSIEFQLSVFLYEAILINKPDYKKPNLQKWSNDSDLMLRIDHRKPDIVRKLITWVQNDDFERSNVLSIGKLRKRFDSLEIKMTSKPKKSWEPKREPTLTEIYNATKVDPNNPLGLIVEFED